jgi:hypothetical protein
MVENSATLDQVRGTFFGGNGEADGEAFRTRLQQFIDQFGMSSEDVKNLTIAAVLGKMLKSADGDSLRNDLNELLDSVTSAGVSDRKVGDLVPRGATKHQ